MCKLDTNHGTFFGCFAIEIYVYLGYTAFIELIHSDKPIVISLPLYLLTVFEIIQGKLSANGKSY